LAEGQELTGKKRRTKTSLQEREKKKNILDTHRPSHGRALDSIAMRMKRNMSSKAKRNRSTEPQATSTQAEAGEVSVGNSARDEEIRRRAYEIYLERGEQPGRALDDWLQAERELERGVLRRAQAG
jgi:DUF2934 family protein